MNPLYVFVIQLFVLLSLGVVVWVMIGRIAPANATSKMIDN